ncbi:MAG: hypothetical protein EOL97_08990 [Spirochaetia bacterium]|nr:hypothetical protein [Spirochaetia bacterium]
MQNKHYNDRFKDAPWYESSSKENILVIGAGGIGSNALYCLSKTVPANYIITDFDKVEEYNIGTQFFTVNQKGFYKTEAVRDSMMAFGSLANITTLYKPFDNTMLMPITITGLDNMKTRKEVFEAWKTQDNRELLIDGRLSANFYEVYVVQKGQEEEYEKTLFNDDEIEDAPCTFKQTAYMAMMIGARITQILVNYLTNKYQNEDALIVPKMVKEYSEPFYFEVL